ncbi:MAG: PQQ-binding-like beta-propeller repeat protein, partial [Planctomycetes bacterium]|nr:PQQ-binding-like beta-propeller repeat protein [Planctomycetota bacterium]
MVVGKTLFYGSTRTDSVVALDTKTGSLKWRFMVGGPVRFAPVAHGGRVYFGSDDSFFYAVNAADGQLIWKFRAAPSERKVIGNDRLISVWPIRGGPVVTGDTLRFTAGVWPIEGTFLFTVDLAKSIDVAEYTAFSLPEIVPQGYLAQSGARLLIPGGRAPVTAYDVEKREFIEYDYRSRGLTDFHVAAKGRYLFHGDRVFDCDTEELIDLPVGRPVTGSDSEFLFFASAQKIQAANLGKPKEVETKDRRGKPIKKRLFETSWELSSDQILAVLNETEDRRSPKYRYELDDELTIDVRAGNRIYGRSGDVVFGIELPHEDQAAKVTWAKAVKGTPGTMIAADDKLFIATREGRIYCYSGDQGHPRIHEAPKQPRRLPVAARKPDLDLGLSMVGVDQGFALIWGLSDEGDRAYNALRRILHESDLRVVAVDPNEERVQRLRTRLTDEGFYGERIELRVGNPADYNWPPYLASVVLSDHLANAGWSEGVGFVTELFRTLRPYGGAACLRLSDAEHQEMSKWVAAAKLSNGEVTRDGDYSILRRVGTLAGTANWEHEYGDPANTLTSPDTLVKPPLGLLWFGGPSSNGDLYYDRHRWPPSMAVVDGRIFLQGPEKLTAVDVYTGRILWQIPIATGLSPGRRGWISVTGFHFVAIPDGIYLTYERSCVRLDPATGKQLSEFRLPNADDHWGRVRIVGDRLIVPVFRPVDDSVARGYVSGWRDDRGPPGSGRLAKRVAVLDRNDGRLLWEREADHGVLMLSVSSNRVFCFDGILKDFFRSEDRKGIDPSSKKQLSLKVWDINTGEQIWKKETLMAMTWLAYSEEHDVLVASNKNGVEAWRGNNGERLWRKNNIGYGFKGHPESVWNK